ncbi:hypothetical protein SAMN05421677_1424 [Halobacillus aidingensis]|uniref:Two-component system, chemotaxis family, response regulator CheY n=1 Tax=Halobacillus aidingensis TaxID=240303 RepID=A0A1H0VSS3_HALAD|nr:hypothetical protein SAMN05421677_1424 [Halobacillus aidingensis]
MLHFNQIWLQRVLRAGKRGAKNFVVKPFDETQVLNAIDLVLN